MRCQAKIRTESGGGVALAPHRGGDSDATNTRTVLQASGNVRRSSHMDLALCVPCALSNTMQMRGKCYIGTSQHRHRDDEGIQAISHWITSSQLR